MNIKEYHAERRKFELLCATLKVEPTLAKFKIFVNRGKTNGKR